MRLVYVEWEDSYGCSSRWQPLAGLQPEPMICRSVGWLAYRDKRHVVVIPHLTKQEPNTDGCGDMTIPVKTIVKLVYLHIPVRKRRT